MKNKILRTPLEPYQTFKDDPLRVLRLIRFAARLGYAIEDESKKAMADPTIHDALRLKISRERVGVEIMKIMEGPDPFGGLSQIYNSNLYTTVFADPEEKTASRVAEEDFPVALDALRRVLHDCASICLVLKPKQDLDIIWTLAAYVPYRADEDAAVAAARAGIKATNKVSKALSGAVSRRQQIHNLVEAVADGSASRSDVGIALRESGKPWRYHVLYSLLCDCVDESFADVSERYTKFVRFVQSEDLEGAAELRPILDGNQIKKALGIVKAGSWLKDALDVVVEWQFANPKGTAEEAQDMIKSKKDHFPSG